MKISNIIVAHRPPKIAVFRCTTKSPPPGKCPPRGGKFPRFPRKFSPPGEYFLGKFAPRGGIFPRKNTPPPGKSAPPGGEVFLGICTPRGAIFLGICNLQFFFLRKCQYPFPCPEVDLQFSPEGQSYDLGGKFSGWGGKFPRKSSPPGGEISWCTTKSSPPPWRMFPPGVKIF